MTIYVKGNIKKFYSLHHKLDICSRSPPLGMEKTLLFIHKLVIKYTTIVL